MSFEITNRNRLEGIPWAHILGPEAARRRLERLRPAPQQPQTVKDFGLNRINPLDPADFGPRALSQVLERQLANDFGPIRTTYEAQRSVLYFPLYRVLFAVTLNFVASPTWANRPLSDLVSTCEGMLRTELTAAYDKLFGLEGSAYPELVATAKPDSKEPEQLLAVLPGAGDIIRHNGALHLVGRSLTPLYGRKDDASGRMYLSYAVSEPADTVARPYEQQYELPSRGALVSYLGKFYRVDSATVEGGELNYCLIPGRQLVDSAPTSSLPQEGDFLELTFGRYRAWSVQERRMKDNRTLLLYRLSKDDGWVEGGTLAAPPIVGADVAYNGASYRVEASYYTAEHEYTVVLRPAGGDNA